MLLAQYQNAVTRVDMVKSFSFKDFIEVNIKASYFGTIVFLLCHFIVIGARITY